MTKSLRLFFTCLFTLTSAATVHAQILNGSFSSGDFTSWTLLGVPQVLTSGGPTPPSGTTQALLQSTNSDAGAISVTAGAIDSALGTTLPSTDGTGSAYPGFHLPINGQAIYQSFTLSQESSLTFAFSFQTNDNMPFDSVGYVLDGTYTQLAAPTLPYFDPVNPTPTTYVTIAPIDLTAATHTLAFVAYNTGDNTASTSLYVTNVSVSPVPEPNAWALLLLGGVALFAAKKVRRLGARA